MPSKRQTAKRDLLSPIGNRTKSNRDPINIRWPSYDRETCICMQNGQRTGKHPHPVANHGILPTRGTASFPRTSFAAEEMPLTLNNTHSVQLLCAGSDGCCRDVYTSGFPDYVRSRPVLYRSRVPRGSVGFKGTVVITVHPPVPQRRSDLTPKKCRGCPPIFFGMDKNTDRRPCG